MICKQIYSTSGEVYQIDRPWVSDNDQISKVAVLFKNLIPAKF